MPFEISDGNARSAEELLNMGIALLGRGERLKALSCFEKSYRERRTPVCQSYLGLCIALERGKISEGLALCEEALRMESGRPDIYLNMGKVLLKSGRKNEAIDTVRRGLRLGHDEDVVVWLESLGIRRKPVFPILPRRHFLNKYAGLLLSRLGLRGPRPSI